MEDVPAGPRVRRAVDAVLGRTVGGFGGRWTEAVAPDLSPGWTPVVHHYTGIRPRAHRRPSTELSPDVGEPVVVCERSATGNRVTRMTGNSREPRAAQSGQRCVTVSGGGPRENGGSPVDECTGCVGERRPHGSRDTVAGPVGAPPRQKPGAAVWAGRPPCGQLVGRADHERPRHPQRRAAPGRAPVDATNVRRWGGTPPMVAEMDEAGVLAPPNPRRVEFGRRGRRSSRRERRRRVVLPLSPCCGGRAA
jgi:hypothetical protein